MITKEFQKYLDTQIAKAYDPDKGIYINPYETEPFIRETSKRKAKLVSLIENDKHLSAVKKLNQALDSIN